MMKDSRPDDALDHPHLLCQFSKVAEHKFSVIDTKQMITIHTFVSNGGVFVSVSDHSPGDGNSNASYGKTTEEAVRQLAGRFSEVRSTTKEPFQGIFKPVSLDASLPIALGNSPRSVKDLS